MSAFQEFMGMDNYIIFNQSETFLPTYQVPELISDVLFSFLNKK